MPLSGGGSAIFYAFYAADGDTTTDAQTRPRAYIHHVTPGFFDTLGIPLTQGRTYRESELAGGSTAVIVSQDVVDRFWPDEPGIGERIKRGRVESENPWMTIIGVVPELKYRALPANPTTDPDIYLPYVNQDVLSVVLHTETAPDAAIASVRGAIRALSPHIVTYNIASMSDRDRAITSRSLFVAYLMGLSLTVAQT